MPMAGKGSRFSSKGYTIPKPLIDVDGIPMFIRALESIKDIEYTKLIIIALLEFEEKYHISETINRFLKNNNIEIIFIDQVTEGQLCTVLVAKEQFNGESLLIIASDSYVESNLKDDLLLRSNADGLISVIDLPGESWSFVETDENGKAVRVAEKERISNNVSTGIYYFKNSDLFIEIGQSQINNNTRVKGEFYIIPVYQKLIDMQKNIFISKAISMWDMGTPESLEKFINHINNSFKY